MGFHIGATPKTLAAPVTKNMSPTYSPEIQGWDFNWLELLEWLEEGGSLATNNSNQLKSQPCIFGEYIRLMFLAGPPGVALVPTGYAQKSPRSLVMSNLLEEQSLSFTCISKKMLLHSFIHSFSLGMSPWSKEADNLSKFRA